MSEVASSRPDGSGAPPSGAVTKTVVGVDNSMAAVEAGSSSLLASLRSNPPPDPLPPGWVLRACRSQPGCYYYFHQETGECRWENPSAPSSTAGTADAAAVAAAAAAAVKAATGGLSPNPQPRSILKGVLKKSFSGSGGGANPSGSVLLPPPTMDEEDEDDDDTGKGGKSDPLPSRKRERRSSDDGVSGGRERRSARSEKGGSADKSGGPEQVRVLHILKKHRGSRRPASWRNPRITDTLEKAKEELRELIQILQESLSDPKELRATFEELARTESDCSSAKRGGDLGFFGRRKMQPAFEEASFGLKIGELSGIVETSSGVHVILRLA